MGEREKEGTLFDRAPSSREPLSSPPPLSVCYSIAERDTKFASQPPRGSRAGLQSGGAKFLTVDTNLLVSVDLGEIGLVFIASLSYICPLPCKTGTLKMI